MSFLNLSNITFSYESSIYPIFSSINLTINNGWYALIGPNGSGKSTLFNLISKNLIAQSGIISSNNSTYLCKQDNLVDIPESFYNPDIINNSESINLLGRLEIKDNWLFNYENLSGGEKKRIMIADALFRNPEVLLIDEPINHLDEYSINLLINELRKFNGIGLIISHDLSFLDQICSKTIIIEPSKTSSNIISFDCKPSMALEQRELELNNLRKQFEKKNSEINKLIKIRNREKKTFEEGQKKLSKKGLAKKDFSAKSKIDGARITSKDKKPGQKISKLSKQIKDKQTIINNINTCNNKKLGITINNNRSEKKILLSIERNSINPLYDIYKIENPFLSISSTDNIILKGQNGSGKSSFLKIIETKLNKKNIPYFFIKQDYNEEERREIKLKLLNETKENQSIILSTVYRLGSNPNSIINTDLLSPGETQKVLYGFAINSNAEILLLDEPTNFLDIISINTLTKALLEFSGALICVSHNKYFIDKIGKIYWEFSKFKNQITITQTNTSLN